MVVTSKIKHQSSESLYGEPGGRWLVTVTPSGMIPPPDITVTVNDADAHGDSCSQLVTLAYMGEPYNVLTRIYNSLLKDCREAGKRIPAQKKMAELIGMTSQQSVSFCISNGTFPNLTDQGWRTLVRLASGEIEIALH